MLNALTLILTCQLAGEALMRFLAAPVPGPVAGMVLLLGILFVRGGVSDDLGKVGDSLLAHLSVLFVPAAVGIMAHMSLLAEQGAALGLALVISTTLTILVTGFVMTRLGQKSDHGGPEHE